MRILCILLPLLALNHSEYLCFQKCSCHHRKHQYADLLPVRSKQYICHCGHSVKFLIKPSTILKKPITALLQTNPEVSSLSESALLANQFIQKWYIILVTFLVTRMGLKPTTHAYGAYHLADIAPHALTV